MCTRVLSWKEGAEQQGDHLQSPGFSVTGLSSLPPLLSRMHTYILFPSSSALHVCFGNLPSAGLFNLLSQACSQTGLELTDSFPLGEFDDIFVC